MTLSHELSPVIVWFRQDLRLSDNPALNYAASLNRPVVFVYIRDEVSPDLRPIGAAQKWWLHHSLTSLGKDISKLGGQLLLQSGPAGDVIANLAKLTGANEICWNRRYGEAEQSVDQEIKSAFPGKATSFQGLLLHEPSLLRTGSDKPYKVYTPFWKKLLTLPAPRLPLDKPQSIRCWNDSLESEILEDWDLLPRNPDWGAKLSPFWQPGEAGAASQLAKFNKADIESYSNARDFPGIDQTSRLSAHLRFGEVSPYQLWHASHRSSASSQDETSQISRETWRKQLVWREFSYHLLQEWPHLATENFNTKFDHFPWIEDPQSLQAWQMGQTGYPIVDAGMRQLYETGWMHNRVRMIVASFLVKHLLIDWRAGERWFWETLVDGDPAANPAQWQWVAGSGADAAPYFRIFNPILQAQKFDPDGNYIRQHVPELSGLDAKYLAAPWQAPAEVLAQAGVQLGVNYPKPIVDHQQARSRALDALQAMDRSRLDG